MTTSRVLNVAIAGCGTVGGATAQTILRDGASIAARSGVEIRLVAIHSKTFRHARELHLPEELFEASLDRIVDNPEIDLVLELIGGLEVADTLIRRALEAGKDVVTANKALLAKRGPELFALARTHKRTIAFEASCGGGIPIVRAVTDGLLANAADALYGILNGTSNYILSAMAGSGAGYETALADAQRDGFAEADPTLDVSGADASHKLALLTSLAFGRNLDLDALTVEGIAGIGALDVRFATELGYVIKPLAVAYRHEEGLAAWVGPAFIETSHPLAWVNGPFNAVSIYGSVTGHTLYYGRGAGGEPTASAVIADAIGLALGTASATFNGTQFWPDLNLQRDEGASAVPFVPVERTRGRYYMRVMAADRPGVLATISSILGRHNISIASLRQNEQALNDERVPVVMTTHICREADLVAALAELDSQDQTGETAVWMPIVEEHPETVG